MKRQPPILGVTGVDFGVKRAISFAFRKIELPRQSTEQHPVGPCAAACVYVKKHYTTLCIDYEGTTFDGSGSPPGPCVQNYRVAFTSGGPTSADVTIEGCAFIFDTSGFTLSCSGGVWILSSPAIGPDGIVIRYALMAVDPVGDFAFLDATGCIADESLAALPATIPVYVCPP